MGQLIIYCITQSIAGINALKANDNNNIQIDNEISDYLTKPKFEKDVELIRHVDSATEQII